VGLCAVAGASAVGCAPVIAVDILAAKLQTAQRLGATHTIDASKSDVVAEIHKICPGGADIAIEATGQPAVMQQALASVRARGGKAVIVGNARFGARLELDPGQFNQGKQLLGSWGGDNQPDRDFPRYLRLALSGALELRPLQQSVYPLEQINQALDDLESGRALRPLIRMA
jgi:S-(hydroxymethyl)glutathione dehydrogenase/alcohol dehydrogenase